MVPYAFPVRYRGCGVERSYHVIVTDFWIKDLLSDCFPADGYDSKQAMSHEL